MNQIDIQVHKPNPVLHDRPQTPRNPTQIWQTNLAEAASRPPLALRASPGPSPPSLAENVRDTVMVVTIDARLRHAGRPARTLTLEPRADVLLRRHGRRAGRHAKSPVGRVVLGRRCRRVRVRRLGLGHHRDRRRLGAAARPTATEPNARCAGDQKHRDAGDDATDGCRPDGRSG